MFLKLNKKESGRGSKSALGETEKAEAEEQRKLEADIKGTRKIESGVATGRMIESRAGGTERNTWKRETDGKNRLSRARQTHE